jgi:carboxypeptidase Q
VLRTGAERGVRWNRLTWDRRPTIVRPTLVAADHRKLMELLDRGVAAHLEFIVENRFRQGPTKLYNVVADIPGAEKPGEYVLVGGHLDSWDGATGAIDDGSGCVTAMEAARLLMAVGARPKRTIRFVLWSGEEQGLLGSRAYVSRHKEELPKISAYLNHDSGTNHVSGINCTGAMKADMERVFQGVNTIDAEKPFKITETNGLRGGGSDHASFLRAGVPAFMWRLSGNHDYGHIWHTQYDHYDQAVEPYQRHSSMVIAIGALGLANLDHLLSREKMAAPSGARWRSPARLLGVEMDGMTITKVLPDSAAARARFAPGDKILRFEGKEVSDPRSLFRALFTTRGKGKAVVLRNGKEVELDLEVRFRGRRE